MQCACPAHYDLPSHRCSWFFIVVIVLASVAWNLYTSPANVFAFWLNIPWWCDLSTLGWAWAMQCASPAHLNVCVTYLRIVVVGSSSLSSSLLLSLEICIPLPPTYLLSDSISPGGVTFLLLVGHGQHVLVLFWPTVHGVRVDWLPDFCRFDVLFWSTVPHVDLHVDWLPDFCRFQFFSCKRRYWLVFSCFCSELYNKPIIFQ